MTELTVKVSAHAAAQIERAAEWWAENRPAVPNAIAEDIAEVLSVLVVQPGIGIPARRGKVRGVRRVTLSRIRYYLSYRVVGDTLEVLAFWHTSRGRQPYA